MDGGHHAGLVSGTHENGSLTIARDGYRVGYERIAGFISQKIALYAALRHWRRAVIILGLSCANFAL